MIHLTPLKEKEEKWTFLFIAQSGGRSQPLDLQKVEFPPVIGTPGLVLVAPVDIWVTVSTAIHYRNLVRWIGIHEPKLKGAVVVISQSKDTVIGELIPVNLPCLVCRKRLRADARHPYCVEHRDSNPTRQ